MTTQATVNQTEFRTVYIDGFEKGVTPEVLYNCLKKYNVKSINMNKLQKSANAEFPSEAIAKDAMLNQNCKPLLKKPIRMSLKCDKAAITEFSLQGLEKVDLNKIYRIASKFGRSCKLGFNVSEKNKVVNRGYVSYTDFQTEKVEELNKQLLLEGVICSPYSKTSKSSVRIDKFAEDKVAEDKVADLNKKIEEYTKLLRTQLKDLCNYNEGEYNIAINATLKGDINEFSAVVVFDNVEKATRFYEEINAVASRLFHLKPSISIRVSEETESLTNLVAFGIKKPENLSSEDFEVKLTETFKRVFKGTIQIKLREIRKKEVDPKTLASASTAPPASDKPSYLIHITMHSEEDGRELMASYLEDNNKNEIKEYFHSEPFINMFCSSAFRKEFKKAKLKYIRMAKDIKDSNDAVRKQDIEYRNFANKGQQGGRIPFVSPNMPGAMPGGMGGIPRMPIGMGMGMGPMPAHFPMSMGPGGMGPMGMGGMGMMGPANINPMGGAGNQLDLNARRKEFLKEKDNLNKDAMLVKKVAIGYILNDLEALGIKDSRRLADYIIKNEDTKGIYSCVENLEELKKKVNAIRPDDLK